MEFKWLLVTMCVVFSGIFIADSYQTYNKTQCKIAAIQHGMSVEDIDKICGKK